MIKYLVIFFFATNLLAQDAVLRYGGPETRKAITGVTVGAQCILTVPEHNYLEDQIVYVTQVTGVRAANGAFKITPVTGDTLGLKTLDGATAPCDGVWRSPSGYIGIAQQTSIVGFPRGPINSSVNLVAKLVTGWAPHDAILQRVTEISTQPYTAHYNISAVSGGWGAKQLMVMWKATGNSTYLDAAKHYLNNFEKLGAFENFYCNEALVTCGRATASELDWSAFRVANFMEAFAIGGDALSQEEQSVFIAKMMNGYWGDSCTPVASSTSTWSREAKNCGAYWFLAHHTYQPNAIVPGKSTNLAQAITATQTTIKLHRATDIPYFPVYFLRGTEWIKIISSAGGDFVNIERGAFGSTPLAHANNAAGRWTVTQFGKSGTAGNIKNLAEGDQIEYDESSLHNLVFAKYWAGIAGGIALAPLDSRAKGLLERSWNEWYDTAYNFSKQSWTGLNQGGTAYGNDRWYDWSSDIAVWAKNSFTPAIDISSGNWLKNNIFWYPYFSIPGSPQKQLAFWDSGVVIDMPARRLKGAVKSSFLYPSNTFVPNFEYFLRTLTNYYTQASIYSGGEFTLAAFLYTSPNAVQTPLAQTAKHYFFTETDFKDSRYPKLGYNAVSSRSAWDSNATLVASYALSTAQDHTGPYPGPGHYAIVKGDQWLISSTNTGSIFGSTSATLAFANTIRVSEGVNQLPVTGTVSTKTKVNSYGQYTFFDTHVGGDTYTYWRVNGTTSFRETAGVNSYTRDFVHLKSGVQDYTIVYDKVSLATAKPVEWLTQHPSGATTGNTSISKSLVGNTFTFTRGAASRITDKILLPNATLTESTNSGGVILTTSAGTVSEAEYLIVHRASLNPGDIAPNATILASVPSNFRALEIEDETICRVILIDTGAAALNSVTFSSNKCTTISEISLTRLAAGKYDVSVAGIKVLNGIETLDGFLQFQVPVKGEIIINPHVESPTEPEFPLKCRVIPGQNKEDFAIVCKPIK